MNRSQLLELLEKLDLHPSRKLGQNFLLDPNMLHALLQDAQVQPGQRVLEIGPGLGMLTEALLDAGCDLTAVELDHRLAEYLRERYGDRANFRLIQGDACKVDFDELMGDAPYRCVANLPYSCSTPFLAGITACANPPTDLCVLLQREMAERLSAAPGTKEYGLPTVKISLRYRSRILRMVPPGVFYPPPEVTSAFTRLEYTGKCEDDALRHLTEKVATAAFSQRRKKTATLLATAFPNAPIQEIFAKKGIPADVRADALSTDAYISLATEIMNYTQGA